MTYGYAGFGSFGSDGKVIGGEDHPDPTVIQLTEREKLAIGAFVRNGGPICTGTVIAPRLVLSAAHCRITRGDEFVIGTDTTQPVATATVLEAAYPTSWNQATTHDDYVLAYLDRELPVTPIGLGSLPLVGDRIQSVGFGRIDPTGDPGANKRKWWLVTTVREVIEPEFAVLADPDHGLCNGDSGGPALAMRDGKPKVIGTISYGETSCTGVEVYKSTNILPDWIGRVTAYWAENPPKAITKTAWLGWALGLLFVGVFIGMIRHRSTP